MVILFCETIQFASVKPSGTYSGVSFFRYITNIYIVYIVEFCHHESVNIYAIFSSGLQTFPNLV